MVGGGDPPTADKSASYSVADLRCRPTPRRKASHRYLWQSKVSLSGLTGLMGFHLRSDLRLLLRQGYGPAGKLRWTGRRTRPSYSPSPRLRRIQYFGGQAGRSNAVVSGRPKDFLRFFTFFDKNSVVLYLFWHSLTQPISLSTEIGCGKIRNPKQIRIFKCPKYSTGCLMAKTS